MVERKARAKGRPAAPFSPGDIVSGLRYENGTVLVLQRVAQIKARDDGTWKLTAVNAEGTEHTYFVNKDGESDFVGPYDDACRARLRGNGGDALVADMDEAAAKLGRNAANEVGMLF